MKPLEIIEEYLKNEIKKMGKDDFERFKELGKLKTAVEKLKENKPKFRGRRLFGGS